MRLPGLEYVRWVAEPKPLNGKSGCMVIIAASGMCTGGRILHHLNHSVGESKTEILTVESQGQGTLGRRLVDGARRVRIFRESRAVHARFHTLRGFSTYADQSRLVNCAAPLAPRFLTHGEDGPRGVLRDKLRDRYGPEAQNPNYGDGAELQP